MSRRIRVPIRHIPCAQCGTEFGQTEYEHRVKIVNCPECMKTYRKSRNPTKPRRKPESTGHLEILLPKTPRAYFWGKKGQYYLRVEVRKKGSNEDFKMDRIYLGVGKEADGEKVQTALLAAYARLQMQGMKVKGMEGKKGAPKPLIDLRRAKDRNLGIFAQWIQKRVYKVFLPDPLVDGKRIYIGRYNLRSEAREARIVRYREIKHTHVACKLCGMMPTLHQGILTHFSSACPNQIQMPRKVRPLMQAKLWNLIYSTGKQQNVGKLTCEQLADAGYLRKSIRDGNFFSRVDVEWDFSLAKNYAVKPEVPEEEIGFE